MQSGLSSKKRGNAHLHRLNAMFSNNPITCRSSNSAIVPETWAYVQHKVCLVNEMNDTTLVI
ncbi:hypothetical protein PVAP13_4NG242111 [Panicum virgatum]|uniref:Uncharacterized protein n=1 Tax=Panicum virgatum TaxID=38727 RepID=A0A8T0T8M9_PANVG|nr:hypothetical protein PVAP13_4NG242111 [Panicum virgatum]